MPQDNKKPPTIPEPLIVCPEPASAGASAELKSPNVKLTLSFDDYLATQSLILGKAREIDQLQSEHKSDKAFRIFFIRSESVTLSELRRAVKILHPDIETTKYIRGVPEEIFKRLNLEGKNVDDQPISVDQLSKKIRDWRYNKNKRLA